MHGTLKDDSGKGPGRHAAAPQAMRAGGLGLALRIAWRDLRGGLSGFGVFIACLALGVMAIAAVASTARGLTEGLTKEGRRILGGDLAISLVQREASPDELVLLQRLGTVNSIATLRAMANAGEKGAALAELKAVDDAYPALGVLESTPQLAISALVRDATGAFGAIADPVLLARLDLKPGDEITLGSARIRLMARLVSEPDKVATGVGFGPRLIVPMAALQESGLIQPGSLIRWTYRIRMADGATDLQVEAAAARLKAEAPDAGWDIRNRSAAAPQVQRNVERFTQFLTLVGLTALLIGGVGVANAVRRFVEMKRADFATLKALGAPGGQVVFIHFIEVMGVAALAVAIGLMLGAAVPFLAASALRPILPLPFSPTLAPVELAGAALFGFLVAALFAILPLGRAHDVPVSALFRDVVDRDAGRPRPRYLIAFASLLVLTAAAAIGLAYTPRIAAMYVGVMAVVFFVLRLLAAGLMRLARALPRPAATLPRLALANITRPGALTPALVLSLGLGVALLTALSAIDSSLTRQLKQGLPERAPSFFFLDIPSAEVSRFEAFMASEAPLAKLERVPLMRGRIVSLKGVPASEIKAPDNAVWVLEGDRGITFAEKLPEGSQITEGAWWPADHRGEALLSFDAELAGLLDLKVGDAIVVNVLGRNITARVANLRKVEWRNLGINFVMVFSPNSFAGAPFANLATASFPVLDDPARDAALLRRLAKDFPAVTAVRVRDALEAVNDVVEKLALAIRAASSLAIIASLLVLAGAIAAGQRARLYDAVILKTLGATRARLLSIYALEYGVIGLASAIVGLICGLGASYAVVTRMMRLDFSPDVVSMGIVALFAVLVAIVFGLSGTWRILSQKPASHLRNL
jgi:putative ABC transport system permease protein